MEGNPTWVDEALAQARGQDVRPTVLQRGSLAQTSTGEDRIVLSPNFFASTADKATRPDGDAETQGMDYTKFVVPSCRYCGSGVVQPNVVFFGQNVETSKVEYAKQRVRESTGILAVGTSLMVYSAYRFIVLAKEMKLPIAILNVGPTRGDADAQIKVEGLSSDILPHLVQTIHDHRYRSVVERGK
eukprot:TRINITY_DN3832_c0_g1_i3.p1 TRINITY_DN3832_c0_g1~~TRINITY_DN3832_c0_g1_i3.p1  ORF type:complete len:186 (-),score=16.06 TRINITY_DN3832_c0_g1_i3:220-777(-)